MLCNDLLYYAVLGYDVLCSGMLYYVMYVMSCHVMLWYVIFCDAMLC